MITTKKNQKQTKQKNPNKKSNNKTEQKKNPTPKPNTALKEVPVESKNQTGH